MGRVDRAGSFDLQPLEQLEWIGFAGATGGDGVYLAIFGEDAEVRVFDLLGQPANVRCRSRMFPHREA